MGQGQRMQTTSLGIGVPVAGHFVTRLHEGMLFAVPVAVS